MAGYTVTQAQAQLDAWMASSLAVAGGQAYSISTPGGVQRQLTRANSAEIQSQIKFWRDEVNRLTSIGTNRRRTRYAVIG